MSNQSIADRFVYAINEIKMMDKNLPSDHPMRYSVWKMQGAAEKILRDATMQALELVESAKFCISEYETATAKDEDEQC